MGAFTGTVGLIFGLFLLIFPKTLMKIFRIGTGSSGAIGYYNARTFEEPKGKWRFGLTPSISQFYGESRAVIISRVLGIIMIIASVFAYLSPSAP